MIAMNVINTSLNNIYIYIYIYTRISGVHKGGFGKGGLAIYALPFCNYNTSGSVFGVQIEHMPNC